MLYLASELNKLNLSGKAISLLAVSGGGKTRTAYEVLSKRLGIYFTASVAGNGGSHDLQSLCKLLNQKGKEGQNLEVIAPHHLNALLLARLLVLYELKKESSLDPYVWLLLQVRPTIFLNLPSWGQDLFSVISQILVKCSPEVRCLDI